MNKFFDIHTWVGHQIMGSVFIVHLLARRRYYTLLIRVEFMTSRMTWLLNYSMSFWLFNYFNDSGPHEHPKTQTAIHDIIAKEYFHMNVTETWSIFFNFTRQRTCIVIIFEIIPLWINSFWRWTVNAQRLPTYLITKQTATLWRHMRQRKKDIEVQEAKHRK